MAALPALSVQLYSVRGALASDLPGTLARLAQIGLTRVELYNFAPNPTELKAALAGSGLVAPTAHTHVVDVDDLAAAFDTAADLGIEILIEPGVAVERWSTRDGVMAIADELAQAADIAAARGMRVGYHNHAFELETRIDGRPALEILDEVLDPAVVLEIDTYWAAVGGEDVPALLGRLGERVVALHLKDGRLAGSTDDQVPLGQGDLSFPEIVEAAASVEYPVIEFDEYAGDIFDGIATSHAYAIGVLGAIR